MNTEELNRSEIGNGAASRIVFLSSTVVCRCTTSCRIFSRVSLSLATTGRATAARDIFAGRVTVTGSTVGRAGCSITLGKFRVSYLAGSTTGRARSSLLMSKYRTLSGSTVGRAPSSIRIGRLQELSLATMGHAFQTVFLANAGDHNASKWVSRIPFENRISRMK